MRAQGNVDLNLVKVESDAGLSEIGEAYWGRGVKNVIVGYFRDLMIGEDPLDVDRLYNTMLRWWAGCRNRKRSLT